MTTTWKRGLGAAALVVTLGASPGQADPVADTCAIAQALGGNARLEINAAIDSIAERWSPENRAAAKSRFGEFAAEGLFAGASAYRMIRFGDDLEEHLVLLRLRGGEVAAVRLIYEWTSEGPRMTVLDFKRRYSELSPAPYPAMPEAISCP